VSTQIALGLLVVVIIRALYIKWFWRRFTNLFSGLRRSFPESLQLSEGWMRMRLLRIIGGHGFRSQPIGVTLRQLPAARFAVALNAQVTMLGSRRESTIHQQTFFDFRSRSYWFALEAC